MINKVIHDLIRAVRLKCFRWKMLSHQKSVVSGGKYAFLIKISLGRYCYVGPGAHWNAIGGITVGDGTIIGPRSFLWTENHDYLSLDAVPYGNQNIEARIFIGKAEGTRLN